MTGRHPGWRPPEGPRRGRARQRLPDRVAKVALEGDRVEHFSLRFAELQFDLGGMAYEMASRDHFRLDVLNKQAAKLQQVGAELGQIEHLIKLDDAGAAGSCPSCGALQARGGAFCWQCGNEVKPPTGTDSKPAKRGTSKAAPKK